MIRHGLFFVLRLFSCLRFGLVMGAAVVIVVPVLFAITGQILHEPDLIATFRRGFIKPVW